MLSHLFTDPDAFFEDVVDEGGLLRPVLVVALVGVLGAIGGLPVLQATANALPAEAGPFATVVFATGTIGALLGPFIRWLLYGVAFFALSEVLYDPEGSFSGILAVTGWGFVPAVFATILSAAVAMYVFAGVTFPTDPAQVGAFVAELRSRPIFLVAGVLDLGFLLWSGFLWTFGIHHERGLGMRESAIVVGPPVALAVLLRLPRFL